MKYYIVGYTYSGKSTFGRKLAESLRLDFLDLDRHFEQRYHYTVNRFFAQFGEQAFRKLEASLLRSTADLPDCVISTGGGTPCWGDNMDFILAHGNAIYLQMNIDDLVHRAVSSRNPRPLFRGLGPDQVRERIANQFAEREPYYLRANIILDGLNPQLPVPDTI